MKKANKKSKQSDKKISVIDIDEIIQQAEMIYGLATVFVIFLDCTEEDNQLLGAMECLMHESKRLQNNCNNLLQKVSN